MEFGIEKMLKTLFFFKKNQVFFCWRLGNCFQTAIKLQLNESYNSFNGFLRQLLNPKVADLGVHFWDGARPK